MSTPYICFHRERKILCGYPLLSVAMHIVLSGDRSIENATLSYANCDLATYGKS